MKLVHILLTTFYINAALSRNVETEEIEGSGTEEFKDDKTKDMMSRIAYLLEEQNKELEETINKNTDSLREEIIKSGNGGAETCERRQIANIEQIRLVRRLVDEFSNQVDEWKTKVTEKSTELKEEIDGKDISSERKLFLKSTVTLSAKKINKGLHMGTVGVQKIARVILHDEKSSKEEKDRKVGVLQTLVHGRSSTSSSTSSSTGGSSSSSSSTGGSSSSSSSAGESSSSSSSAGGNSRGEKLGNVLGAVGKATTQFKIIMDPEKTWQERTAAGFTAASELVGLLPPPYDLVGSSIFGVVAAALSVAAPTTNEYRQLRNQVMKGIKNLLDENQQAEAMGCVYKIEFLKGILEMYGGDATLMAKDEFFAVILAGGVDIGVKALATFRYKMETYRDKNTIEDGRSALDMAHVYVKIAENRDMLNKEILTYIKISGGNEFTSRFFENTIKLAHRNYQYLFFWEDTCCQKDDNRFSALLAYNLPIERHAGTGNAVAVVSKFIKECRTSTYYNDVYNGITENTKLSYDTVTDGADGMYEMGQRPPPVDNKYYLFKNFDNPSRYLGESTSPVGFSYTGILRQTFSDSPRYIQCDDRQHKYLSRFGVSEHDNVTIQFLGPTPPVAGEPRAYDIHLKAIGDDYDFFLTPSKTMTRTGHYYGIIQDDPKELMISCVDGIPEYKSLPHARLRMFKVKLKSWPEAKFLISPVAELSGEEKLYFFNSNSKFIKWNQYRDSVTSVTTPSTDYVEVPLPKSDENDPTTLLDDSTLTKVGSEWRKLWFEQVKQEPIPSGISQEELEKHFGKVYQFQSFNYPQRMFRHSNFIMLLEASDTSDTSYKSDSSFTIERGLAGKGVTLQSLNYPDRYLRHRGGYCFIEENDDTERFKEDASFIMRMGLASTESKFSISFESVNAPGFFIRHFDSEIGIAKISNSNVFKQDASWVPLGDDSWNETPTTASPSTTETSTTASSSTTTETSTTTASPSTTETSTTTASPSTTVYQDISSGTCTTVSRRDCDNVAEQRGISGVESASWTYTPPGCYHNHNTNKIYYNDKLSSPKACTERLVCICKQLDYDEITSGSCTSISKAHCQEIGSRTGNSFTELNVSYRPPGCYKRRTELWYNNAHTTASCEAGRICLCQRGTGSPPPRPPPRPFPLPPPRPFPLPPPLPSTGSLTQTPTG